MSGQMAGDMTPHSVPSEVFLRSLTSEINKDDVQKMVGAQSHMLTRFEKTVEMLLNFNVLSESRYATTQQEFKQHTQLLTDMKRDLDSVFRRIRSLKETLNKQYPGAFKASSSDICDAVIEDEEEEEEEEVTITVSQPEAPSGAHVTNPATTITMTTTPKEETQQPKTSTG